jgi:hypothetical protein
MKLKNKLTFTVMALAAGLVSFQQADAATVFDYLGTLSGTVTTPGTFTAGILATEALRTGNIRLRVAHLGILSIKLDSWTSFLLPPELASSRPTRHRSYRNPNPGQVLFLAYGFVANATSRGFFRNGFPELL